VDLFKYTPVTGPTYLEQAEYINGYDKVSWVERYFTPGEFSIEASLNSGLKEFLPVGTFVSHNDTMEVMIVENHEIDDKKDEDSTIKITGRDATSFLENRIVGTNIVRAGSTLWPYILTGDVSWNQAVQLINDHINSPPCTANDVLPNFTAATSVSGEAAVVTRIMDYNTVLSELAKILAIDNCGIRTIRRNTFGSFGGSSAHTTFDIYRGADKTSKVMFSWVAGDIDSAKYLFTDKNYKTSAIMRGRWTQAVYDLPGYSGYTRRIMYVDCTDIDQHFTDPPVGDDLTWATIAMVVRGQQALTSQKSIAITQVDLSNTGDYHFRRDYNLGDLVMLDGNYGQKVSMRVTEFAEIQDAFGYSSHPTLSLPGV